MTLAIGTTRRAATTAICRRPTSGDRITRFVVSRQPDDISDRDSYRGNRFTSQAALATEAQDYRGGDAVALGLADATGHALDAFDSFVRAVNAKN